MTALGPVTRATRRFSADKLEELSPEEIRRISHVLFLADGATVTGYTHTGEYDQFHLAQRVVWRSREVIVRIYYRPIAQADIDALTEQATYLGSAESVLVATKDFEGEVVAPAGMHLVDAEDFVERIVRTPLVTWNEDQPEAAIDRFELFSELEAATSLLDPIGIRWLPQLALNEDPVDLIDSELTPQDLLERKAFRLLTATFRFRGDRYGESKRGRRLPDAVLFWPNSSATAAILDCKAAGNGYRMESDHLLRFQEYWDELQSPMKDEGHNLRYLIVLSSFFPGVEGDRHPYFGRANEISERTGLKLVYLRAADLSWAAAKVEAADLSIASRERLDWDKVFEPGLVEREGLRVAVEALSS